jgi:hypothetical protein
MNVTEPDRDDAEDAESALEATIREGGMDLFPADTRAEVERILAPGQALEPVARTRLVEAARRGTLARSAGRRPVERLLFESRRAADRSIEKVAEGVGTDAAKLTGIERGDARITELDAKFVAKWIETLGVDGPTAISALTTSLAGTSSSPAYAAGSTTQLKPKDEEFVAKVRSLLGLGKSSAT